MIPLGAVLNGKLNGNISRSQQILLSCLLSISALNCSLAWDPDSRRFPLQAFDFIFQSVPRLSAILRDSPRTPKEERFQAFD